MKTQITALREAGFATHWLHPKTKRPIGKEWSTAPVQTVADLLASYRDGNNAGVRLGEPSLLTNGLYLHAFDMDIRVADLADEAWDALRALLPAVDLEALPCVASGSGGESRHLYFGTSRAFRSKILATSDGKHRGTDGSWHFDWEIELFGTGKQVVLPPSIHPDTGKPYVWLREFDLEMLDFGVCPEIPAAVVESLGAIDPEKFAFEDRPPLDFKPGQMERELDLIPVSDLHYDDWIRLGQALHHQFGGSQEGFDLWLLHTKRSAKFTGDAQIREMRRIKWRSFGKYRGAAVTMASIRQWARDAATSEWVDELDDLDDDDVPRNPEAPAADAMEDAIASLMKETPADELPWQSLLDINEEGGIKPTLHNVELVLKNDTRLIGLAQINEFTQETVQRTAPGKRGRRRANQAKPTRELTGRVWHVPADDERNGVLWSDDRDFAIRTILEAPKTQGGYGIKVSDRDLKAGIVLAANDHAFHPVQEYLLALKWDGVSRVDGLWVDYVGATDDRYHRDVARLMMTAAVTRIFEPGHKFDFATILEGLQGKRKSTLIEVLGCNWSAELDGDFHDSKSLVELMQGSWIMEIPELTGFGRADVRAIKAFISRRNDRVRLAYARRAGQFPRQCIFVGSTNDREYLKDDTGGRRFWPVQCNLPFGREIDTELLKRNIDQLWAEAVQLYRAMRVERPFGTLPLYLSDPESRLTAARLQESRRIEGPDDVLAGRIAEWLDQPVINGDVRDDLDANGDPVYRMEVCTAMIWVDCMGKDLSGFKTQEQGSVNRAMSKVPGWESDGSMRFPRFGKQRVFRRGGEAGKFERMGLGDLLS
ncbi:VapE domain-containing protein [Sphingomonas sp. TREG-RG-20F-R18-01]|uniref:VapE domain-containing protein n=1 Tax=Sphingomonas sp. TREG-RG-20F-R18-01 TaxID=2914982 RepID=UPI001F55CE06|nr:VapE domain-containing protein [Sphingomonas sp. TREG-RG-20F-R18-01]